jgi:sigma-B regulation protein RsbU (phosphoserine phosphatase)
MKRTSDPAAAELARKNAELHELSARLSNMAARLADDLRLASKIQRSLLPAPLEHPRLEVAREFIPFREIGGDYYDFVSVGPDRVAFAIGDVMGKGVAAALLAASLRASVRAQLQTRPILPSRALDGVNGLFREVIPSGIFASLFFGVFDLGERRLDYANAGHPYPLLVHDGGTAVELVEGGPVVGLVETPSYAGASVTLERDDLLVFFSDGVTERTNAGGEMYGAERLKQAAVRTRAAQPRIALYSLLGEIQDWSAGVPAEDDTTLIVAKIR